VEGLKEKFDKLKVIVDLATTLMTIIVDNCLDK
jgi:hypothetical protein